MAVHLCVGETGLAAWLLSFWNDRILSHQCHSTRALVVTAGPTEPKKGREGREERARGAAVVCKAPYKPSDFCNRHTDRG